MKSPFSCAWLLPICLRLYTQQPNSDSSLPSCICQLWQEQIWFCMLNLKWHRWTEQIPLVFVLVLVFSGLSKTTVCIWWVDWTEPMGNAANTAVTKLTFISFKSTQIRPVSSKIKTFVDAVNCNFKCAVVVSSSHYRQCCCLIWMNPTKKKPTPRKIATIALPLLSLASHVACFWLKDSWCCNN